MSTNTPMELLKRWLDFHTSEAGITPAIVCDRDRFDEFMSQVNILEQELIADTKTALSANRACVPREATMAMLATVCKPDGGQSFPSLFDAADIWERMYDMAIRQSALSAAPEPAGERVTYTPEQLLDVASNTLLPTQFDKRMAVVDLIHALEKPDATRGGPDETIERLTSHSTAEAAGERVGVQFSGRNVYSNCRYLLVFADQDRGCAMFDDKAEAIAMYRHAEQQWTCSLYEAIGISGAGPELSKDPEAQPTAEPSAQPAVGPLNCRAAGGHPTCDMCAAGHYEKCRYTTSQATQPADAQAGDGMCGCKHDLQCYRGSAGHVCRIAAGQPFVEDKDG